MSTQLGVRRLGKAAAVLLAVGLTTLGAPVSAQEASPSGQTASPSGQVSPPPQTTDTPDFPWGLLGLLGLGGLAGLRRRPEPVREGATKVGVYEDRK